MSKAKLIIAATMATIVSLPAAAQTCKTDSIKATINPDRLIENGDGTVTDAKTGLMWTQCSLGQEWTEAGCSGAPTDFDWEGALQASDQFNHNGGLAKKTDWRMPNIKEIGSLVEHQCHSPAINLVYFPDTPSATYFSSTAKVDQLGNVQGGRSIDFAFGSDLTPQVSSRRHVRLVRSN